MSEKNIIDLFQRIENFKSSHMSDEQHLNLINSLAQYDDAMMNFNRIFKFRDLFIALELAANSDGIDRKGTHFDDHIRKLTGISNTQTEKWRHLYTRIKHIQRDSKDMGRYIQGIHDLPSELPLIRKSVCSILLQNM